MHRLGFAIVLVAGLAGRSQAGSPDPKTLIIPTQADSRARDLVQQLGSEVFQEREQAQTELARMGRLARPALCDAVVTDPNPEVRHRCQSLLPRATALDLRARLDTFLADADGKFEHDLPGWNQFRIAAGAGRRVLGFTFPVSQTIERAARKVFVGLLTDMPNRTLLLAVEDSPTQLGQMLAARKQELYNLRYGRAGSAGTRREPTDDDVITLLFAESQIPSQAVPVGRFNPLSSLFFTPAVSSAFTNTGDSGQVCRAVLTRWADSRTDAAGLYQAMQLTERVQLWDASVRAAVRLFDNKGATPSYRGQAAVALARHGGRQHVPLLQKAMTDTATMVRINQNVNGQRTLIEIQVRDVALVTALFLTNQDPTDYGLVDRNRRAGLGRTYVSYTSWHFPEGKRESGFEKWKAWTARHPAGQP